MARYIELDALVAEIEKAIEIIYAGRKYVGIPYSEECIVRGLQKAEDIINSFKVKEVDLEKEMSEYFVEHSDEFFSDKYKLFAKHFFELGLRASNSLTWKDIDLILDITDQIANDDSMEEKLNNMSQEEYCTEVLKRFKAQKGE